MKKLAGKTAIVTGASRGIGLEIARLFAHEGAQVYLTDLYQAETEEAAADIGLNVVGVAGDITIKQDRSNLLERVRLERGTLDTLVMNAAFTETGYKVTDTDTPEAVRHQHVDRMYEVNVKGTLYLLTEALPLMGAGSTVVVTGSSNSTLGIPNFGTYAATKAALRSYVRTWTAELAPLGIRVNLVSPGATNTASLAASAASDPDMVGRVVASVPLGRMTEPEEVASAVLFLACSDSSFIAGVDLPVDGGMLAV